MESMKPTFVGFPKMARLERECIVTEKIDGTNAQIHITNYGELLAASRTRYLLPGEPDNFGFRAWCEENRTELLRLGPGRHFGEWWGSGIQRRYGLTEKRFSLFNTTRWESLVDRPACCHLVPVLYQGLFSTACTAAVMMELQRGGSRAAPGFMKPEGIVVFHTAAGVGFKQTFEKDGGKEAL